MRGYYTVHDLDTLQFGITPHSVSTKSAIVEGTIPPGTTVVNPRQEKIKNYSWYGAGMTVASLLFYKLILTRDPFEMSPNLNKNTALRTEENEL